MKFRYYTFLCLASLLLLWTACESKDDESLLAIVKTTISTDPSALSGEIEMSAENFDFRLNGGDWCEVTKQGNLLKLNAGANYGYQNRTLEIIITPKSGKTIRVPVTQQGILFELTDKTRSKYSIGFEGGQRTVSFLKNVELEVVIPVECQSWLSTRDDGDGNYTIFVEPSEVRRVGTIDFKYVDMVISTTISQYDYLPYTEVLGPAVMTYWTDEESKGGVEMQTDVEIVEKVYGESYILKGTFSAGIPREIPMDYIDHVVINGEDYNGQFRFRSGIIDENFTDPAKDTRIVKLACRLVADEYQISTGLLRNSDPNRSSVNSAYFYPSEVVIEPTGVRFNFIDIPGCYGSANNYYRVAKGIALWGVNSSNLSISTGYENMYHISLFKEVN